MPSGFTFGAEIKKGDRVRVRDWDEMVKIAYECDIRQHYYRENGELEHILLRGNAFASYMKRFCGYTATVTDVGVQSVQLSDWLDKDGEPVFIERGGAVTQSPDSFSFCRDMLAVYDCDVFVPEEGAETVDVCSLALAYKLNLDVSIIKNRKLDMRIVKDGMVCDMYGRKYPCPAGCVVEVKRSQARI